MSVVPLGEIATIERRGVDPTALPPDTLYLGLEHIERGGRIIGRSTVAGAALTSTKFWFSPEHVLLGKLRPNLGKVSRPDFEGVCSTDILPIRPGTQLDRDYLAHYLARPSMVAFAASRASGANLPRLSPSELTKFPVPLPPLSEQRRIAAILDQAEAIRAKHGQVLTHLDALTQSVFHDMFSAAAIRRTKLGDRLEFLTSGSRGWARYYADAGDKFIRIQNVGRGELRLDDMAYVNAPTTAEARRTSVQAGDVLLSITADLGRTAVIPEDLGRAYISQHLALLRAPSFIPAFLSAYLQSADGQRQIKKKDRGATKAGLNFDDVRSIEVPTPDLREQRSFADFATAIEKHRAQVERTLAMDDELFASLQSRAFKGEL